MGWRISKRGGSPVVAFIPWDNGRKRDEEKSPQIYDISLSVWGLGCKVSMVRRPGHSDCQHPPPGLSHGAALGPLGAWDLPGVSCSISFVVIMVNLLLCLTYNLNSITGMYVWEKHSTHRGQHYLWLQASTGVLGTYFLCLRGGTAVFSISVSPSFLLFSFNYLFHLPILSFSVSTCC